MALFIKRFTRYCGSTRLAWLLVINVGVFLALLVATLIFNLSGARGNHTIGWFCVPADPMKFIMVPWTLVTYMFVQYDFWHLLFNVLWLFWFGRLLLTTLSGRHLVFLYLGGGIAGAILYLVFQAIFPAFPPANSYLCGASAAVLAIIVSVGIRTPDMEILLFLFGNVRVKWIALVCVLLTFLGVGGSTGGAQVAHVGGVIFGVTFAMNLKRGKDISAKFKIPALKGIKTPKLDKKIVSRRERNVENARKAIEGRLSDVTRLDQLLDKIRTSGYDSLTLLEKNEL